MPAPTKGPAILIATNNRGKVAEMAQLLCGLPLSVVSPAELGIDIEVPETGSTYAENARSKALGYATRSGMLSVADDTGLEIDALKGWPGLHSARFAGPTSTAAERRRIVLQRLGGRPLVQRRARFVCHIAVANPSGIVAEARGVLEGKIAAAEAGHGGFGYDSIFIPEGFQRTLAELSPDEKNQISHRARALAELRPFFDHLLQDHEGV